MFSVLANEIDDFSTSECSEHSEGEFKCKSTTTAVESRKVSSLCFIRMIKI